MYRIIYSKTEAEKFAVRVLGEVTEITICEKKAYKVKFDIQTQNFDALIDLIAEEIGRKLNDKTGI